MTSTVVRAATEADWPAIAALLDRVLAPHPFEHRQRLWRWRSDANPARVAGFPVFLVAERDGVVVGAHGLIPLRLHAGAATVPVACACDFAVEPAARGVGMALKLKAMDKALAPVAISTSANESANKLTLALKGKQLDSAAVRWIKPLRASGLVARRVSGAGPRTAVRVALGAPDVALRLARGIGRMTGASRVRVDVVGAFDARHDALWDRVSSNQRVMFVRDAAYLRWRYAEYPFPGIETYHAVDGSGVHGVIAVHHTRDADGLDFTAVLDLFDDRGDPSVLRALLDRALAAADHHRSHYVTAQAAASEHVTAYREAGFRRRQGAYSPYTYMTKDAALAVMLDRADSWVIGLGDGDLAFYLPH